MRKSDVFVPEFSLVAELDGEIVGHDEYYPRFGFKPADIWDIKPPFDVPKESFMALELESGSLVNVSGVVVYPKEFL